MLVTNNLQNVNSRPVDTLAPLSWFSKAGYYIVNNNIFRHKLCAMQEATRLRLGALGIKWVFNDEVYKAQDWKNPLRISLPELYRLRAQQLRDQYNYLILSFSGGGDSSNVLDSFILNNIHLDEVLVVWPRKYTSGKYVPTLSTDPKNFVSEWDYLIEPKLNWLRSIAPKTKINIVDPYETISASEYSDDFVTLTTRHNYIGYLRLKAIDKELLSRQKTHKNCSLIMGVDPPKIARINRHVVSYFTDASISMYGSDYTKDQLYRNVEYFYWTPDMPEIVVVQSHALLNAAKSNPKALDLIPSFKINPANSKHPWSWVKEATEETRRWMKHVLYPTYNSRSLQVDKNDSPVFKPDWYAWFYDNQQSTELDQAHYSAVTTVQNLIDPCFFNRRNNAVHDYIPYYSKFYYLGELDEV